MMNLLAGTFLVSLGQLFPGDETVTDAVSPPVLDT